MKLIDRLFESFQRRCPHDPGYVTADILEGCAEGLQVQWCRRCGAARVVNDGHEWDWREPRATWWVKRPAKTSVNSFPTASNLSEPLLETKGGGAQ